MKVTKDQISQAMKKAIAEVMTDALSELGGDEKKSEGEEEVITKKTSKASVQKKVVEAEADENGSEGIDYEKLSDLVVSKMNASMKKKAAKESEDGEEAEEQTSKTTVVQKKKVAKEVDVDEITARVTAAILKNLKGDDAEDEEQEVIIKGRKKSVVVAAGGDEDDDDDNDQSSNPFGLATDDDVDADDVMLRKKQSRTLNKSLLQLDEGGRQDALNLYFGELIRKGM